MSFITLTPLRYLTSELVDLRSGCANPILAYGKSCVRSRRFANKTKNRPRGSGTRTFAYGEDTHDLRLTSELVDLRSGYANPILAYGKSCARSRWFANKTKNRPRGSVFVLAAELGFEPRHTESESAVLPLHNSAINFDVDYFSI